MKDSAFDRELERIVARMAGELAEEIKNLLLRQLGLDVPARATAQPKRAARPARTPADAGAPARTAPRRRARSEDREATLNVVERAVAAGRGMSVGQLERQTGLSRGALTAALKALKDGGRVFMGGTRRFARYASSQAAADKASIDARGGADAGAA